MVELLLNAGERGRLRHDVITELSHALRDIAYTSGVVVVRDPHLIHVCAVDTSRRNQPGRPHTKTQIDKKKLAKENEKDNV